MFVNYIARTSNSTSMRIISWNVNGIRASVKKGLVEQINNHQADIWCFQETKAQDDQVTEALSELSSEYHIQSTSAVKRAIQELPYLPKSQPLVRRRPLGQADFPSTSMIKKGEY